MNHSTYAGAELDQTDEDIFYEVSDEALEAVAGNRTSTPSPMYFATKPPKRWTVSATAFW